MKTKLALMPRTAQLAFAGLLLSTLNLQLSSCLAQGTAFTYQGRLNERGAAANGTYDFRFTIYNRDTGSTSPLEPVTADRVAVSNGLFTVELDFGVLGSTPRWLEIEVQSRAGGSGGYVMLSPRQLLTATPRAHYALEAGDVLNPVPDALIPATVARLGGTNVFTGQVSFEVPPRFEGPPFTVNTSTQVPNLNADYLDGFDSSAFWKNIGNAGTSPGTHFLGTTDNQPLELRANNQRALRIVPNTNGAPNILAGSAENHVAPGVIGATIVGGGGNGFFGDSYTNRVLGIFGTVMGGANNTASGPFSTAGGANSTASGHSSVALGGFAFAEGQNSFALGSCTASGSYARALGTSCEASGQAATAMGNNARAAHRGAFVWGDSQNPTFASTANDQFLIRAAGGVGINTPNPGALLQVGDEQSPGSQGMIRLASRSGTGLESRHWDIGVPQGNSDVSGKFYSFTIDDPRLGTDPEVVVRWDTGNVGIGVNHPNSRLHVGAGGVRCEMGLAQKFSLGGNGSFEMDAPGIIAGRFVITDAGDVGIGTANPLAKLHVAGSILASAGICANNGIQCISDRNAKTGFAPVDAKGILEKVAALSITRWRYTNDTTTPHLGPVAQDFHAAFGVGSNDKTIATVDADGVALAAIQGLNEKVEVRSERAEVRTRALEQRLEQKETEITELKARLTNLEKLINNLSSKGN